MVRIVDGFMIDNEKAEKIARVLRDLHERGHELARMPEYILPRNLTPGGREHALYFTYVIAIDYLTDSERLWRNAREAYELDPRMFTPEAILEADVESLAVFLRRLGARHPDKAAIAWKSISRVLVEKYGGDPRNIARHTLTVKEAWREAARKLSVAPWKLDKVVWNVGSKMCRSRVCGRCPVEALGDKAWSV